jgi:hypothetical protein
MKCPLILAGWNATRGGDKAYEPNCRKEDCAWWVNNSQQCAINKIGAELWVIGEVLEEIRDQLSNLGKIISIKG